jgi:hypothetical protein
MPRLITIFVAVVVVALPHAMHAQVTGTAAGTANAGANNYDAPKPGFVPLSDANFSKIFNVQSNTNGDSQSLSDFVKSAFKISLSIGAILAVLRIAWAGYQYMLTDSASSKSHAKEILGNVTIGLLILLGIWLILNQINPQLLTIQLHGVTSQLQSTTP